MDTKEKTRGETRQRGTADAGKRPEKASRETMTRREAPRKKRTAREAEDTPRRKNTAGGEHPDRRQVPSRETRARAVRQEAPPQPRQAASAQRPAQTDGIRFSAPQGTGPRKSAPKMSAQEASALHRQQQGRSRKQPEKKKNALQSLLSGSKTTGEASLDAAAKAELRRKQRAAREEKKRKTAQKYDTPTVIYTQPQAFNRDRLLIQLLSVVAVVAAMVIGMSVFFKVKTITVAGAETYSTWAVAEASGIEEGDSLLTFSKARAIAKVHAELSYVDNVRIGIKLPDTVIIYIEELDVAYAVESDQGDWWLINSSGRVVEQIRNSESANYTQVKGVTLEDPQVGLQAVAANQIPEETLESGEPVPVTVTGAQRLSAALQILKALEANDIVGDASSVDVTELEDIVLNYGSQYEVLLGDSANMEYKIACMNDVILEMSEYQAGILDISFTHWTDQVGFTPFG